MAYNSKTELTEMESLGKFSKGLPHNNQGVADLDTHAELIDALKYKHAGRIENLCRDLAAEIPGRRKLVEPTAGFFSNIPDTLFKVPLPTAPATYTQEKADEYKNVAFWAANREKTFEEIEGEHGTDKTRIVDWKGVDKGPWLSQFLIRDFDLGMQPMQNIHKSFVPGNYGVTNAQFVQIQNGVPFADPATTAAKRIQTPQDIGSVVRRDKDAAYWGAMHTLLGMGMKTDSSWLKHNDNDVSIDYFVNQSGPTICNLMQRALAYSLQRVWAAKWDVTKGMHIRPEAYAGILQHFPQYLDGFGLQDDEFVKELYDEHSNYFLPLLFGNGSPQHGEHPQGHSGVSISVCTILKMIFDEDQLFPDVQYIDSNGNVQTKANTEGLTVGGELSKMAYNIGQARVIAGVHFDSSVSKVAKYAEAAAEAVFQMEMRQWKNCYVTYTAMDGTKRIVSSR